MKYKAFTRTFWLPLAVCCSLAGIVAGAEDAGELFGQGLKDFTSGKYKEAAEIFRGLHQSNPGDDIALYMLAGALAQSGESQESLKQLKALVDSGSCLKPRETTFQPLADSPEYQSLAGSVAAARSSKSRTAITIPEPDFFPEGIAYDAAHDVLFVGSIRKRKIVRINIKRNKIEPFAESKQDGLMAVLGMKVQPKSGHLWAVSVADPTMMDYSEKEDAGMNAVYEYDGTTGKLIRKYTLSGEPAHYLNDLDVDSSGRVYVTDSANGEIFTIAPGETRLESLIGAGKFVSPNGIAVSADGKTVYVADTLKGIYAVNPGSRAVERVQVSAGIETLGIDGLYFYKNSLVGVFNMTQPGRIMKFDLDASGRKVAASQVLECGNPVFDDPTTAALAGDSLYFIANSQLRRYNPDGTPFPIERLDPIRIQLLMLTPEN